MEQVAIERRAFVPAMAVTEVHDPTHAASYGSVPRSASERPHVLGCTNARPWRAADCSTWCLFSRTKNTPRDLHLLHNCGRPANGCASPCGSTSSDHSATLFASDVLASNIYPLLQRDGSEIVSRIVASTRSVAHANYEAEVASWLVVSD